MVGMRRLLRFAAALVAATPSAAAVDDFVWGTATAAFQIEGSTAAEGRTPSVWDEFSKPEYHHVRHNGTGEAADEDYKYYAEKTLPLLRGLGVKHYRMSISWTRVLQYQTAENPAGEVNAAGLAHYEKVLDALLSNGIEPVVTMWHWDTPEALEVQYGGFLSRDLMPKFFEAYARVLLKRFGDKVKYWITLNEPLTLVTNGYNTPAPHAPGRCSNRSLCAAGNDRTEPYLAAHTLLVSHGCAFQAFRELKAQGTMGITLNGDWCEPLGAASAEDQAAATRCVEYQSAWFFDPIFFGRYPASMRDLVAERLPEFTAEELGVVHGSHMGVYFQNLYTAKYAQNAPLGDCGHNCDGNYTTTEVRGGMAIGPKSPANDWLYSYPVGFRRYLAWISERYRDIVIIVSENGWGQADAEGKEELLNDIDRCNYYREYIGNMSLAHHEDGVDVRGYFAWSLMDNFEWGEGYTTRFGLTYVDYETQERTPKLSYHWFARHVAPLKQLPKDGVLPECVALPTPNLRPAAETNIVL